MVGAADSVRLGRLTAIAAQRHLAATLAAALLRPDEMANFIVRTPPSSGTR